MQEIEFEFVVAPSITPELVLNSDPQRISQIIINVLSNALAFMKHSKSKRITIEADLRPAPIPDNVIAYIAIRDASTTIAADLLPIPTEIIAHITISDPGTFMTQEAQRAVNGACKFFW